MICYSVVTGGYDHELLHFDFSLGTTLSSFTFSSYHLPIYHTEALTNEMLHSVSTHGRRVRCNLWHCSISAVCYLPRSLVKWYHHRWPSGRTHLDRVWWEEGVAAIIQRRSQEKEEMGGAKARLGVILFCGRWTNCRHVCILTCLKWNIHALIIGIIPSAFYDEETVATLSLRGTLSLHQIPATPAGTCKTTWTTQTSKMIKCNALKTQGPLIVTGGVGEGGQGFMEMFEIGSASSRPLDFALALHA